MTTYVDDAAIMWRSKPRYHLTATSIKELHEFAASVGIRPCWFHRGSRYPHYDITAPQRDAALAVGAIASTSRQVMEIAKLLRPIKT